MYCQDTDQNSQLTVSPEDSQVEQNYFHEASQVMEDYQGEDYDLVTKGKKLVQYRSL